MSDNTYVLPENCDFSEVGNNSTSSYKCSPDLGDPFLSDFRGLLINGPKKVSWSKNEDPSDAVVTPNGDTLGNIKLMVCGLLSLDVTGKDDATDLARRVIISAVNQKTGKIYSGKIILFGDDSVRPPSLIDPSKLRYVKSHFNIDLMQNLEVPFASAIYTVYATLDDYQSNVIEIEVDVN